MPGGNRICMDCAKADLLQFLKEEGLRAYNKDGTPSKYYRMYQQKNIDKVRKYSETQLDFRWRLIGQGYRCQGCGMTVAEARKADRMGNHRTFVVDHDHEYGYVRGLLCRTCNIERGK